MNTTKLNLGGVVDLLISSGCTDQAMIYLERFSEGQEEVAGYIQAFQTRIDELSVRS